MVKLDKIYTRTGDKGRTRLATGEPVDKWHPRVIAYGTVDETNAALGMAALEAEGDMLAVIGIVPDGAADASDWLRFVDQGTVSVMQVDFSGSGSDFEDVAVIRDGRGLDMETMLANDVLELY